MENIKKLQDGKMYFKKENDKMIVLHQIIFSPVLMKGRTNIEHRFFLHKSVIWKVIYQYGVKKLFSK